MIQIITLEEDEILDIDSMERSGDIDDAVAESVANTLSEVKTRGDEALAEFTEKFDGAKLSNFRVPQADIDAAEQQIDPGVAEALRNAYANISAFHFNSVSQSSFKMGPDGRMVGYRIEPLGSVGLYVPGGRASYPSTVLMNATPAKMAGVGRVVMTTPPDADGKIDPTLLYAAKLAGVDEIYAVGGAQAIAALAYGTETIKPVDKIVGPGNSYVAAAKKLVSGTVGIDLQAGPSEILILADDNAVPAFVAADMLSQAEHDPEACCYLVAIGGEIVEDVVEEMNIMTEKAMRKSIIEASVDANGVIIICPNLSSALRTVNDIAPEHLEVMVDQPMELIGQIHNAGAIFLGPWTPVAIGDYIAGPSHTLPTSGTARFSNPLTTDDFVKKTSIISYSYPALAKDAASVVQIAESEGFGMHSKSVTVRLDLVNGLESSQAEDDVPDEAEEDVPDVVEDEQDIS